MAKPEHEMSIDDVLAAAHRKHGHDGVYETTPADDMMRREESVDREEWAIRVEAFRQVLEFCFQQGPHPGHVVRRVFCLAKAFAPELVLNMGVRDLGKMFGESHGCWSWRIKQVVVDFVKVRSGQNMQMGYQKSPEARAKYSAAQQGNRNRRNGERRKRLSDLD